MKKQQIEFDFSKWGQEGISVKLPSSNHAVTLHKSPLGDNSYYGISTDNYTFHISEKNIKMYQEAKPREIWVNEYPENKTTNVFWDTKEEAEPKLLNYATPIRTIKFREVFDDEQ